MLILSKIPSLADFLKAFVIAFISTGLSLGVIYVLITRAIDVDREDVEAWFEEHRRRLQSGPVPVLETAHPVMCAAVYAIYGREVYSRLKASFVLGGLLSLVIFCVVYWEYKSTPAALRQEAAILEQNLDPKLYSYASDPRLQPELKNALQTRFIYAYTSSYTEHVYRGAPYDELRERVSGFQKHLVSRISESPDKVKLMPLVLFDGTYLNPGFRWLDSSFLFLFNVIVDFVSVTVISMSLEIMDSKMSLKSVIGAFSGMCFGTLICTITSFASYRLFFGGDTGFFVQFLVILPLSVGAMLLGVSLGSASISPLLSKGHAKFDLTASVGTLCGGAFWVVCGAGGLWYLWAYWRPLSLTLTDWRDAFSIPYVLAATTLVPAGLVLAAFTSVIAAKLTIEPARTLQEAYMTFMKEEVGGRQAAGIIGLISVIVASIVGVLWH